MNCESVSEQIMALAQGSLDRETRNACRSHIAACQDCADALRGVRAMLVVRDQATVPGSERVFNRIVTKTSYDPQEQASRKGFWLGAGFSAALAASLLDPVTTCNTSGALLEAASAGDAGGGFDLSLWLAAAILALLFLEWLLFGTGRMP